MDNLINNKKNNIDIFIVVISAICFFRSIGSIILILFFRYTTSSSPEQYRSFQMMINIFITLALTQLLYFFIKNLSKKVKILILVTSLLLALLPLEMNLNKSFSYNDEHKIDKIETTIHIDILSKNILIIEKSI